MPSLSFHQIPDEIAPLSTSLETVSQTVSGLLEVPAVLGWANHAGVRQEECPLRTHVCASSYDHINEDVSGARVARLYANFPQPDTVVSLADQPGAVSREQANAFLREWGVDETSIPEPSTTAEDLYGAAPRFVLHRIEPDALPLAIVACRYAVTHCGPDRVLVDVTLDAVAVAPDQREQGLGHLIVLEASRWLGMLTRCLRFSDRRELAVQQAVHSAPTDALGYQLAQCFLRNYTHFSLSQELIDEARAEGRNELLDADTVRIGHAAIEHHVGVEDMIRIPPDAIESFEVFGDDELDAVEVVHDDAD